MSFAPGIKKYFTTQLLKWNTIDNDRELPWKNEQDPYKIWLSEIILQQTRAEQGRPYYEKFIHNYPDIKQLAAAPDDEVFRLWQGLGYYNRCRNLLAAARAVTADYDGRFPKTYETILALKGIGPYTAAAIASFAFQLPYAVLDGNVFRVLSRYFGIDTPIDSTDGKVQFQELADDLMDKEQPAAFNQAIMDFGASVCTPKLPRCGECPLSKNCIALKQEMIALLPVKSKKLMVKERAFHYLVLTTEDEIYLQQRNQKDIWQGLYEFFLIETAGDYQSTATWESLLPFVKDRVDSDFENRQKLTHQLIKSTFHLIRLHTKPDSLLQGIWVKKDLLKNYPFPKTILSFLNRKKYF
jgi:A/G-specific adenine glycosylase